MNNLILTTEPSADYELLDSGEGEKLERYGTVVISRPRSTSVVVKTFTEKEWEKADAIFEKTGTEGHWKTKPNTPKKWEINFGNLNFL
jgi:23S rRNA (cytosine1962-C5)-methyltransferase